MSEKRFGSLFLSRGFDPASIFEPGFYLSRPLAIKNELIPSHVSYINLWHAVYPHALRRREFSEVAKLALPSP